VSNKKTYSKTKTSYYRRLYVAYLIDSGTNTTEGIIAETGMPRRTLQDTIQALADLDIIAERRGGTKAATYSISKWGAIDKAWIKNNLQHVKDVLEYP
jgi:hypothetical protein